MIMRLRDEENKGSFDGKKSLVLNCLISPLRKMYEGGGGYLGDS